MNDLAAYLRQVESAGVIAKGQAIAAMREKGVSWRQIGALANRPPSTIRSWYLRYQDAVQTTTTEPPCASPLEQSPSSG